MAEFVLQTGIQRHAFGQDQEFIAVDLTTTVLFAVDIVVGDHFVAKWQYQNRTSQGLGISPGMADLAHYLAIEAFSVLAEILDQS